MMRFVTTMTVFVTCLLIGTVQVVSGTRTGHKLLVVLFDGLRFDLLGEHLKSFEMLAQNGVRSVFTTPPFPTMSSPSMYTIATGLYVENHGVVHNSYYNATSGEVYGYYKTLNITEWWDTGAEPVWVTGKLQGLTAGSYAYPGGSVPIKGVISDKVVYSTPRTNYRPLEKKIDDIIRWLSDDDIDIVFMWHGLLDDLLHVTGKSFLTDVALNQIDDGDDLDFYLGSDGAFTMILPKEGKLEQIYEQLSDAHPHMHVYKKAEVPKHLHFSEHERILPLVVIVDPPYTILTMNISLMKTQHGYDYRNWEMWSPLYAIGPRFKTGYTTQPFESIHLYPLMCELLGLQPAPNNGSLHITMDMLKDITTSTSAMLSRATHIGCVMAMVLSERALYRRCVIKKILSQHDGAHSDTGVFKVSAMRTLTNMYLSNQAIVDCMFLSLYYIVQVGEPLSTDIVHDKSFLGPVGCFIVNISLDICLFVSEFNIVLVTFERYMAICKPFKADRISSKTRTLKLIVLTWIMGIVFSAPIFEFYTTWYTTCIIWPLSNETISLQMSYSNCFSGVWSPLDGILHSLTPIIAFVLVITIIIVLNALTTRELQRGVRKYSVSAHDLKQRLHQQRQIVVMLAVTAGVLFVCLLPYHLDLIIGYLYNTTHPNSVIIMPQAWNELVRWLPMVNSSVNPIIYGILNKQYRIAFITTLGCYDNCHDTDNHQEYMMTSLTTTNTTKDSSITETTYNLNVNPQLHSPIKYA
uniref:Uncharacterized protein LOC100375494 n=1 Tax=Saccoglossus kowalevskii TaxID=10224 RepID=A0ABM0GZJ0_SACKO|nr:PREDICTED: uncharacterized protein LOC100375494 [Saccoglossus kowalevskii]